MPSTYTSSNRFEQPGIAEQDGTWGNTLNADLQLIDSAVSGFVAVSIPDANITLTVASGAADQARMAILQLNGTLTAVRSVTVPAVSKIRAVFNNTNQPIVITCGASNLPVGAGRRVLTYCDGTDMYLVSSDTSDAATLNGQPGSYYTNASNLNAGTVPSARLPSALTTNAGIVQLNDTISSTSTTQAGTARVVKLAYDAATNAQFTANAASTSAGSAQTTANTANTNANTAISNAATAQTAANNAQSTANAANTTANSMLAYRSRTAKAFANVTVSGTTPTVTSGFGVSSITRTNPGQYRVNFSPSMPNDDYCVVAMAEAGNFLQVPITYVISGTALTTSVIVGVWDLTAGGFVDTSFNVVVMGGGV